MAERCDRRPPPGDQVRERAHTLAAEAIARGAPTAWFDALYREAKGDAAKVPWADLAPNPRLAAWAATPGALDGVRRALVVGCGLGHDAEHLAALGLDVTAFDVSPEAIAWARRLHPTSPVRYEVADLFALPPAWSSRFDLVVEIYTLQALPQDVRCRAADAVRSCLAPHGRLFLFTRLRDDGPGAPPLDERASGPPWPLGRHELSTLVAGLASLVPLLEVPDPTDARLVRAHAVYARR